MYTLISREAIHLPPGAIVKVPGSWQDYCALLQSRGDAALPRIKYRPGEILLMSPSPRHGREANILADIVKALLDSQSRNYEAFTPITMDLPDQGGIEPDYCFYIEHWQAVMGRDRIDWQADPPPDLVIEIDVTTYTAVEDYLPFRVPEVWLFKNQQLKIYTLQGECYQEQDHSRCLPQTDLLSLIDRVFQLATEQGTGTAIRSLRQSLSDSEVN